jgi:antitoxin HicB
MNSKMKEKRTIDLAYYLEKQYPVTLYSASEGGYVAEIKDLPGCITQGETAAEALEMIEDARQLWLETAYQHGDSIPLPSTEVQYSGKTLLRMPRSLHQSLVEGAERENVSLNQYLVSLLSQAITRKSFEFHLEEFLHQQTRSTSEDQHSHGV